MSSEPLRITILVDNHAAPGLMVEHGLSLWIEVGGRPLLFDTGQGTALAPNAGSLGVNLSRTERLVLSHGHYDHTGGIAQVLTFAARVEVYAHAGVVQPRYSVRDGQPRLISMPHESMAALDRMPSERLHWVAQPMRLNETIGITGPIARETDFEDTGGPFYLDPEARREDPIDDDLAVWFRTANGLVVCAGCCHAGLINTLNQIRRLDPGQPIVAVIGGFHLVGASEARLAKTVEALHAIAPQRIMPCHCTGDAATAYLRNALGEMVQPAAAGMTYRF
jgi:7,8-dihydropterin-6-yl-methyl-4-(beta-D-ribofuranosyl)aminobenzene 5'-phosphate synthase